MTIDRFDTINTHNMIYVFASQSSSKSVTLIGFFVPAVVKEILFLPKNKAIIKTKKEEVFCKLKPNENKNL